MKNMITEKDIYEKYASAIQRFYLKKHLPGRLPEDETIWFYFTILHSISYSSTLSSRFEATSYRYCYAQPPDVLEEIGGFIHKVLPDLRPDDDAYVKIEAFLANMRLLTKITPRSEMMNMEIVAYMRQLYPTLFYRWHKQLKACQKTGNNLRFRYIDAIAASLTTLYASSKRHIVPKPVKILFAVHGPAGFDEYIIEASRKHFTEQMQVEYFSESAFFLDKLDLRHVDLIISNYDLHLPREVACPLVRLSNIPTAFDWKMLDDALGRL